MTNISFLLTPVLGTTTTTTTAAAAATTPSTSTSTSSNLLGLLGHPHHPFAPHPRHYPHPHHPHDPLHQHHPGANGSLFLNSTTRAYRTEEEGVRLQGDGGGGGPGGGGGGELGSCEDWQDAQHTLFQLANLCVAVSFLTPVSFRFHLLFLRCLLLLAFGLFVLWGSLFMCMGDVLGWNLLFFLLDGGHIAWMVYRHLPSRLPLSHASLYTKVFKPVRVGQAEFLELCELASLQPVNKGGLYAMERLSPCAQRVSILLKGRLKVTYQRMFLHYVEINQFVDAAEYDSQTLQHANSDKYQVSIAATEDSVLLTWEYPALQEYLSSHPFMQTLVHYLIGKDVCNQLYAIQEQLLQAQEYLNSSPPVQHSSMVNLRSCLAAHDSSFPPSRVIPPQPPDPSGGREWYESPSRLSLHHHNTLETRL